MYGFDPAMSFLWTATPAERGNTAAPTAAVPMPYLSSAPLNQGGAVPPMGMMSEQQRHPAPCSWLGPDISANTCPTGAPVEQARRGSGESLKANPTSAVPLNPFPPLQERGASMSYNSSGNFSNCSPLENPGMPIQTNCPSTDASSASHDDLRSNVFVCGISSNVRDNDLEAIFCPFGEVVSAKVMLDIHSGQSRGIAFVKYTTAEAAERAIQALNGRSVDGMVLTVRVANSRAAYLPGAPTNKLFIRNVPLAVGRASLMQHFSQFGVVSDIVIHADTASKGSGRNEVIRSGNVNIAFITFSTPEMASAAAAKTHRSTPFPECEGVPLLAKVAEDNNRRTERLQRRLRNPVTTGSRGPQAPIAPVSPPMLAQANVPFTMPTAASPFQQNAMLAMSQWPAAPVFPGGFIPATVGRGPMATPFLGNPGQPIYFMPPATPAV